MNDLAQAQEVSKEVVPIADQALMIVVKDQSTLVKANDFYLVIDQMRKKIKDVFNPIVESIKETKRKADLARAEAMRQWEKVEEPLIRARAYLDGQIVDYKREQDRIRLEQEELLRQKAIKEEMERRKKEEEERLAQAAELEGAGATEEAEALIQETIQEQEEPIQVYIPPAATPKVELKGIATVTLWHAEVIDIKALCRAVARGWCATSFVEPNMVALNKQATSLKGEMKIPGVKAVSETNTRPTGRR